MLTNNIKNNNNNNTLFPDVNFIKKNWFIIDASNKILGRLSTLIVKILRGKHKEYYSPYIDCGDNVIIINSDRVLVSGKKRINKIYYKHTNYPGSLKKVIFNNISSTNIIKLSVKRMMPKESFVSRFQFKSLYIYRDSNHLHNSQKPIIINDIKNDNIK